VTIHLGKGHGQGYMMHFMFWAPSHISGMAEARAIKFCIPVGDNKC